MVTAELGIGLGRVVLIAVGERIAAPCIPRVLRDRTDPQRVNAQSVEISLCYLSRDTGEVTALIIDDVEHLGAVHLPVISGVAVVETVNHQRVQHLRLLVMAVELCRVGDDHTVLHRQQQVVVQITLILCIYTQE